MKQFHILGLALLLIFSASASAQSGQRWYQIEVSLFTHEIGGEQAEHWTPERVQPTFPERLHRLEELLDTLDLADWSLLSEENGATPRSLDPTGPREGDFRLPDLERDAFMRLPASEHNFRTSNQRLDNSPAHRLLWHDAWRQPMTQRAQATPIAIAAGRAYETGSGLRHELEGSLRLYFNAPENRVVLDADLWLSRFQRESASASRFEPLGDGEQWQLPPLPELLQALPAEADAEGRFRVEHIFPMRQTRDMRSNEFHYLDHPALGIIVEVFPYIVPPADQAVPLTLPD